MKILKGKTFSSIIIVLTVSILLSFFFILALFQTWQNKLADSLYSEREPINQIIIVAIDDKSIQEIGRWPWSRTVFANFFNKLDNTSVIGVDIGFFEPQAIEPDKALADSIKKHRIVMPVEIIFEKEEFILKPIPELINNTELGVVNIFSDSDGITRKAPLRYKGYESFASKIYELYNNKRFEYDDANLYINFVGAPGKFEYYSMTDIINNRIEKEKFKDKIILVGATSADLHDTYFVPTSEGKQMPGVEIHANILNTMMTRNFLHKQSQFSVILLIILFSVLTITIFKNTRLWISTIITAGMILIYLIASILLFRQGTIMNIIYPELSIIITYVSGAVTFYVHEKKSKSRIIKIFGKYVSKHVANEILKKTDEGKIELSELKGIERTITILFGDIRGFTTISEKMKPKEVVHMLNTYLGEMTKAVFKHDGTVDKYIGDCIMAIYNAPIQQKDHALAAVKSAIDIQNIVKEIHKKDKSVPAVKFGIGINTGEAVIGNIGSEERMEYTAIGDNVNLASRLCGAAAPDEILISESTYQLVQDQVVVEKKEPLKVKGKEKPVQVYRVVKLK